LNRHAARVARWTVLPAVLGLVALGCQAELVPPRGSVEVAVPYATSRAPTGTTDPRRFYGPQPGPRALGVVRVRVPHDPRTGERETGEPVQRTTLTAVEPADALPLDEGAILVFVHGFSVSFPNAARQAAQLAYDVSLEGRVALFAWPSASLYGGDEVRVLRAAVVLREWLEELAERDSPVHLIAHGMGARALATALRALARDEAPAHFGEVILVAPDIAADLFIDEMAAQIAPLAERVTVYASANERALHHDLEAEALGDTESGLPISPHFETIDASAVDTSLFGHALSPDRRSVVTDVAALLAGGPRHRLEQHIGRATHWSLEGPPFTAL